MKLRGNPQIGQDGSFRFDRRSRALEGGNDSIREKELKVAEASSNFKPRGVARRGKVKVSGIQETSFRCSVTCLGVNVSWEMAGSHYLML